MEVQSDSMLAARGSLVVMLDNPSINSEVEQRSTFNRDIAKSWPTGRWLLLLSYQFPFLFFLSKKKSSSLPSVGEYDYRIREALALYLTTVTVRGWCMGSKGSHSLYSMGETVGNTDLGTHYDIDGVLVRSNRIWLSLSLELLGAHAIKGEGYPPLIIGEMSVDTRFRDRSTRPIRHRQDDRYMNNCDVRPRELQVMLRYV